MRFFATVLLLLASFSACSDERVVLTNAYSITLQKIRQSFDEHTPFDITGTVIQKRIAHTQPLALKDSTGVVGITDHIDYPLVKANCQPGDIVRITGVIEHNEFNSIAAQAAHVTILGHGPKPPAVMDISAAQIQSLRFSCGRVRLKGVIIEARRDETDPDYAFLMLYDQTDTVFITLTNIGKADLSAYVGAEVEVIGMIETLSRTKRRFVYQEVRVATTRDIRILRKPEAVHETTPPIDALIGLPSSQFARLGLHHACGQVIAVLQDGSAFIRTARHGICRAELVGDRLPRFGDFIKVTGIPATDLYHINLLHASWKTIPPLAIETAPAKDVNAAELPAVGTLIDAEILKTHGALVRIRGTVSKVPNLQMGERQMLLDADNRLVPVEVASSDLRGFAVGSKAEVTGVCVLDIELWHPNTSFARVKGSTVVPRNAADIRILARPPWWTTRRLMVAIGILLAGLFAILVWNAALRRAAVRKGRELMREQLGVEREKMKTEERTRLAVELHDTLAQNLTGVSMEIAAGNYDIAAKALRSCRDELRNCLWDLRGRALEETNMTNAILRTLLPHASESQLKVRFEVSRNRLSDNAAHAVLSVIRELTINAIRHGDATTVQIAGALDADGIKCSVADNGRGFDPDNCPGILQGHFGLQGIRERVEHLGGELKITSTRGRGTKAVFTIAASHLKETKEFSA